MKTKELTTVTYTCLEYFPPAYEEESLISLLSKIKSEQVIELQKFFFYMYKVVCIQGGAKPQ